MPRKSLPDAFYIMSLKWTQPDHRYVTFWRPEGKGYAWPLEWSGVYSADDIRNDKDLNDGKDTLAVPVEVARSLAISAHPRDGDWKQGEVVAVPNTRENMEKLRRAARSRRVKQALAAKCQMAA